MAQSEMSLDRECVNGNGLQIYISAGHSVVDFCGALRAPTYSRSSDIPARQEPPRSLRRAETPRPGEHFNRRLLVGVNKNPQLPRRQFLINQRVKRNALRLRLDRQHPM